MAIRWAIMCDTLYFSPVGRHFPEPPISLVLQVSLSAHFSHYTHFVKSSRPPPQSSLAIFKLFHDRSRGARKFRSTMCQKLFDFTASVPLDQIGLKKR